MTEGTKTPPSVPFTHRAPAGEPDYRGLFETEPDVSPMSVIAGLLKHARLLIALPLSLMALVVGIMLTRPREYQVRSSFTPQGSSSTGRLTGLAAQLGMGAALGASGETVDYYADLLSSPELLRAAATTVYRFPVAPGARDSIGGTLLELYGIGGATRADSLAEAVRVLERGVSVTTALRSNFVYVESRARWPHLAELLNRRLLDLVNEFNLKRRQSRAAAEREFVGARLEDAQQSLASSEARLQSFFEQNRQYRTSPELSFEATRLQRRVDLAQQLYTSLAQSYADASMEQMRNTPSVTIVDQPEGTAVRASRGVVRGALLALMLGLALAVLIAFATDFVGRERANNPEAFAELRQLRRQLFGRSYRRV